MQKKSPPLAAAIATILLFGTIMFFSIVALDTPPHISMLLGCGVAGGIAALCGSKWEEIEQGMIKGITHSLISLIILMLIGILIGVWITSGIVPSMIYYGLRLLNPRLFLVSAMLICSLISMTVGSWGTAGTIGLAMMGIAQAMGIPAPLTAGAIISGAYLGDKLSPLSDTTNLASAVTGVDVFRNVTYMVPIVSSAYLLSGVFYFFLGRGYGGTGESAGMAELATLLGEQFNISLWSFLPLVVLIVSILLKLPSIASIGAGILAAGVLGVVTQGNSVKELFEVAYSGFVMDSGNAVIDTLLSAGGLESMMLAVSLILCAMMFGGIMEETGLIEVLMRPLFRVVRGVGQLIATTVLSCILVNIVLPEQYISIALPCRMFAAEYDRQGIDRRDLTRALGAGGAATSPLIPWNTCGVFMAEALGISAYEYGRFAFLNLLVPLITIMAGFIAPKLRQSKANA